MVRVGVGAESALIVGIGETIARSWLAESRAN